MGHEKGRAAGTHKHSASANLFAETGCTAAMSPETRTVVAAAVALLAVLAAVVLADLFGTVLFAITVAFVLLPVQSWFERRAWPRGRASVVTAALASTAVLAVLAPLALVTYQRSGEVTAFLRSFPTTIDLGVLGLDVSVARADLVEALVAYLPPLAVDVAVFVSAASIKLALFAVLVVGLLRGHERARAGILAPVPPGYRPVVAAFETRARDTLASILVLQVGTAAGAFLLALPFFWLVGYDYALVLAVVAGVLQFVPVVGPIVLLAGLAGVAVLAGDLQLAAVLLLPGGLLLGWLPDVLVRPRLARYTGGLSSSLYFVGFIGGLTSLGMIGVVAGPLVVALLVEGVEQLAAELPHTDATPPSERAE
jgi:predicted PurR-regulated permease PerM